MIWRGAESPDPAPSDSAPGQRWLPLHRFQDNRMTTNKSPGTSVYEVAHGSYRINTPVALPGVPVSSISTST